MNSVIEQLYKILVDTGWTRSEEVTDNGESTYFFIKDSEMVGISYEPFPDYEVVEDIFGEEIAKIEMEENEEMESE